MDGYCKYVWAYGAKLRSDIPHLFRSWLAMVQQESNHKLDTIICDQAGEYKEGQLREAVQLAGVKLFYTATAAHQQNGLAERTVRTLKEGIGAILSAANIGRRYWVPAMEHLVACMNKSVHSNTHKLTPHQLYYNTQPNNAGMRVFGCIALYYVPKEKRQAFEGRARWGVFLGLAKNYKAWAFLPITATGKDLGEIQLSTAAHFFEHWNWTRYSMHETKYPGTLDKLHRECEELLQQAEQQQKHGAGPSTSTHEELSLGEPQEYPVEESEAVMGRDSTANSRGAVGTASLAVACRVAQHLPETPPVDDAVQLPHARLLAGVEEMHLHDEIESRTTYSAARSMVPKPMVEDVDNNSVSEQQVLKEGEQQTICLVSQGGTESVLTIYAASLSALVQPQRRAQLSPEPISLQEAERRADWQEWKQAMQKEIDTIHEQQTWELAELPPNVRALGVKWVLVVKTTATGAIERYKARLVVQGFRQIKGVDFDETYAPVARFTTFRVLMALLAGNNLHARQLDVKNAFLYGVLDDTTVYVKQPPHFEDGTHRVCKLLKSLYGLKQAPLVWYSHIEATLRTQGWTRLDTDWGLFIHEQQGLWLLLYVDDIIILGPDEAALDSVLTALEAAYKMKRENFSKYLGINVAMGLTGDGANREVTISLAKYCSEVQAKYGLNLPTKAWVPLTMDPSKVESTCCDTPAPVQVRDYQSQVGSLQWVLEYCYIHSIDFELTWHCTI